MSRTEGQVWVSRARKQLGVYVEGEEHFIPTLPVYSPEAGYIPQVGDPVVPTPGSEGVTLIRKANTLVDTKVHGVVSRQDPSGKWEVVTQGPVTLPLSRIDPGEYTSPADLVGKSLYTRGGAYSLTTNRLTSAQGGRNVVELGVVTRANSSSVTLHVDLGGDSQGPVGTSVVEYPLGVDLPSRVGKGPYVLALSSVNIAQVMHVTVDVTSGAGDPITPWAPSNYWRTGTYFAVTGTVEEGIPKVFMASAGGEFPDPSVVVVDLGLTAASTRADRALALWNALVTELTAANYSLRQLSVFSPLGGGDTLTGPGAVANRFVATGVLPPSALDDDYTYTSPTGGSVTDTLRNLINNPSLPLKVQVELVGVSGRTGMAEASGDSFVTLSFFQPGVLSTAGSLVIADKKSEATSKVVGILSTTDPVAKNSLVMVQKIGTIGGFSGLIPGRDVFLGDGGEVTQDESTIKRGEWRVFLGVARDASTIDLNVDSPVLNSAVYDEVPVGTVLTIQGLQHGTGVQFYARDPNFLHCNGATVLRSDPVYGDLFAPLIDTIAGPMATSAALPNSPSQVIKYRTTDFAGTGFPVTALRQVFGWARISDAFTTQGGELVWAINHRLSQPLSNLLWVLYVNNTPQDVGAEPMPVGWRSEEVSPGNTAIVGYTVREQGVGQLQIALKDGLYRFHGGAWEAIPLSAYVKFILYEPRIISTFVDVTAESRLNYLWETGDHYTQESTEHRDGYMTRYQARNLNILLQILGIDPISGQPVSGGISGLYLEP